MNKYTYILLGTMALLLAPFSTHATTGGDSYLSNFSSTVGNPEQVLYYHISSSGRGCPPEVLSIDTNTGASSMLLDCDMILEYGELGVTQREQYFENTLPLKWVSLTENNIAIENQVVFPPAPATDLSFGSAGTYLAVIKQDGVTKGSFEYKGCADTHMHKDTVMFDGLMIPSYSDRLVIVASSVAQCEEYGYLGQSLGAAKDLTLTNTSSLGTFEAPLWLKQEGRIYPGNISSASPRIGSILLTSVTGISADTVLGDNNPTDDDDKAEIDDDGEETSNTVYVVLGIIILLGIGFGAGRAKS